MAKTIQTAIEAGSRMAPAKFYIKITPDGPYLLYGNPPMDQEIIVLNDEGSSWTYRKGNHFSTTEERVSQAIEKTEQFFQSLGLSTRLSQEKIGDTTITEIENRFNERNAAFGEAKNVTGSVAREILESCK